MGKRTQAEMRVQEARKEGPEGRSMAGRGASSLIFQNKQDLGLEGPQSHEEQDQWCGSQSPGEKKR